MRLRLVFLTVFVIAAAGLGYELLAGTLASYLLGDSVTQFSIAIGLYLFALGVGAWLSRFVEEHLVRRFVDVEIAVALLGGTSAAVLMLASASGRWFRPLLYGEILAVGTLVGLEIPLLLRILKDEFSFKDLVSAVLTLDYIGALFVALLFPLFLVPHMGLVRTGFALGILNGVAALWSTWIFGDRLDGALGARTRCLAVMGLLVVGLGASEWFTETSEDQMYADEVVYAKSTPYQRMVVTRNSAGFQLFLNGGLQFSSADEYRYHEALVHPAFSIVAEPRRVLVLGGGDGLAVREVLRHAVVERVTLVDIDPEMTDFAKTYPPLRELNGGALEDPRVHVVNDDAMHWLEQPKGIFDVVIADFPDPNSFSLGKLYTTRLYERVLKVLASDGALAIQSTSPLFARRAYWCVVRTVESVGLAARPYHAFVPSFGEWGFVLASRRSFDVPSKAIPGLKHLDGPTMASLFTLSPDMGPVHVDVNKLNNQILVHYYEEDWRKWSE